METGFIDGVRGLPRGDRRLLAGLVGAALLALALGIVFGALTGLVRAGVFVPDPETGYRLLTLHGATIFFYWLYFAQAALLLALAAAQRGGPPAIALRPAAWAGFLLMAVGFVLSETAALVGEPTLYDAPPLLGVEARGPLALFYVGYLALALGLALVAAAAVATVLVGKREGRAGSWSAVGFAAVAWAGLLVVSSIAAFNVFLPAALWALGIGPLPADYETGWHILFHNMHYLPLMATVVLWYVLVQQLCGVTSIFGARFSKAVFALYLVFVPPTSLYHMFLEPGLAPAMRALGSVLSLFIGVPTLLVFLVIVASLEVHARAGGARGLFGWLRRLPWGEPAMAAIGAAAVNLALGGVFAFVLIQAEFAPLLSDSFFVPGYFHFLTVGTVTLTFLGAFAVLVPALAGRRLWRPALLARLPWGLSAGLLLFGGAGLLAGLQGAPRRVLDVAYEGGAPTSWVPLMQVVGAGGIVMTAAVGLYVLALALTLVGAPAAETRAAAPLRLAPAGASIDGRAAWLGPLSVALFLAALYAATALTFAVLRGLPILAIGG